MSGRILVIEDDPASLDLMRYLLMAHGFRVLEDSSGDGGLAMARQELPELIICDIQLPGLDGYAVATAMKSDPALRGIPIVAVSAMAMVGDRERGLAAGFDAYLSKPIDPVFFISQIQPLLKSEHRAVLKWPAQVQPAVRTAARCLGTLLVVDDVAVNLELKRSIFEPLGYQVLLADTVALGVQLAREHLPALIISDLSLPHAGGFELLRMIKAEPRLRDIPVIIISATYQSDEVRMQALRLGAVRFLVRPLDAQQVVHEVTACLASHYGGQCGIDSGR